MSKLEASAWMQEHFGDWLDRLTAEEVAGLGAYKAAAYTAVNTYLRKQTEDPVDCARAQEIIPHLDSALAKQLLPHAVIVYRHYDLGSLSTRPERLLGHVLIDQGFTSASLLVNYPKLLQDARGGVIVELCVPAGIPAGCPDLVRERSEYELLLARGLTIRITGMVSLVRLVGEVFA